MVALRRALVFAFSLCACDPVTDPRGPTWEQIPRGDIPERWGHVAVWDAARDRMIVFGGDGYGQADEANLHGATSQRNDLWALDLGTRAWTKLAAQNAPGPRTDLAGMLDTTNDRLVIVGGRVGFATSIDEVWAYSFASATWTELPSGPPARHDVPGASDGRRGWVFGGAGAFLQSLADLWEIDFATDTWRKLPDDGGPPAARTSGALEYYDGALYVTGGHDALKVQADSWRYDLKAQRWSKLEPEGAAIGAAHFGHALDARCGAIFLSAGDNLDNYNVAYTSALVFRGSLRFSLVRTSNLPPPRDHPSMIIDGKRHALVLFGGGSLGDGLGTRGDGWVLGLGACP